jgi:hypothetical protein
MEEAVELLNAFGVYGLWGVILYKSLDFIGGVGITLLIAYLIKKAWPSIIEYMD